MEDYSNSRDKEYLKAVIKKKVTAMFDDILNVGELVVADDYRYKKFRSNVLRAGNDCIRSLHSELRKYNINFIPDSEDVIKIYNNGDKDE